MGKLIDLLGLSRFKTKCDALYAKAADTYTKTEVDALEDLKVDKTSNPITSVTETDGTVTVSALDGTETTFEAGGNITIDDAVSSISENPVQNRAVTAYLYALQNKIANITLSSTTDSTTGAKNIVLTKGDGTKTGVTVNDQNVKMTVQSGSYKYPLLYGALTSNQMIQLLEGSATQFYATAGITKANLLYFQPSTATLYCPKFSFSGGNTTSLLSSVKANTSAIEALGTPVSAVSITDNTMTVTKTDGTSEDFQTYSLPIATADTLGGIKVGTGLAIDDDGTLSASGVDVDLSPYAKTADLATVATSGSYNDLTDIPALDEKLSKTGDTAADLTVTDLTYKYLRSQNGLTMYTQAEDDDGNPVWLERKLVVADAANLTGTPTAPNYHGVTAGAQSTAILTSQIATKYDVETAVKAASGSVDLSNYYTKAEVDSAISAAIAAITNADGV